jgi:hypothetical protein
LNSDGYAAGAPLVELSWPAESTVKDCGVSAPQMLFWAMYSPPPTETVSVAPQSWVAAPAGATSANSARGIAIRAARTAQPLRRAFMRDLIR